MKIVESSRGSRFLRCLRASKDGEGARFPKYPPQPVVRCEGYEVRRGEAGA